MKRFILGSQGYRVFNYLWSSRYEKRIEDDLRNGVIRLTKEDILMIPPFGRYADIFLVLIRTGVADPLSHPKLLEACFRYYCTTKMIQDQIRPDYGNSRILQEIETVLLASSGMLFNAFLMTLPKLAKKSQTLADYLIRHVPGLLDTDAAKELSWWSHKDLDTIRLVYEAELGDEHSCTRCLVQRWLPDLKELYRAEKAIQKMKMDHCKEQLMMNRWHPDRVLWHLERGIEIEDM